ncbi:uncharacterized protein PITG_11500 [Phytophthora infestans T30-4]|uniref:Uncharacterized protein n=1 Tax=Phytophthora infestans (strain T30-4) TaxID=403677 RepID=D0NIX6_PHYIT|nr:uncharacterized protein PITG_11500 [Phytophthora infestans T30-4]EEY59460.1 hypothetical protein PITG_11500 [Phytophthora infestans T30-4]|eukprot:XP_002901070.1 hypothetical protein PITG_11500 [Phytophthora infestans T30-4]
MEASCGSKETDVEVAAACVSIVREENVTADIVDVTLHRDKLNVAEQTLDVVFRKNDERLNDREATLPDDALNVPQQGESSEKREAVDTAAFTGKCLISNQYEDSSFRKCFLLDIVVDSESKAEPEDENESDENNQSVDEVPAEEPGFISCSDGRERSPPRHTDVTEGETTDTLAALAIIAATEIARTKAAKRISRFLLPKLQARQVQKTHAVVQIQCLARVYLAKLCMDRVRLALLHSLRAQLLASWQVTSSTDTDEKLNEVRGHDPKFDQNDDEDDELDQELQGYQPSTHEFSDEYIHVLPTWNGQIPPGVPLLRSSAGAPLLSLWKWSWPDEKWISNNQ